MMLQVLKGIQLFSMIQINIFCRFVRKQYATVLKHFFLQGCAKTSYSHGRKKTKAVGHCVNTLPIWEEIEHTLKDRYKNNHKVMVADIQDDVIGQTPYGPKIDGFPTIWCISRNGTKIEPIEHAKLMNRPRTIDGFVEWIELKTPLSYNSQTIVSEKRKKRYRVTPFPRRKSSTRKFTNSGTRARKFKTRKWTK